MTAPRPSPFADSNHLTIDGTQIDVLFDANSIAGRVETLAVEIADSFDGRGTPHIGFAVVPLLRGSFVFAADLVRSMSAHGLHPEIDFLTVSSYGDGTVSSGQLTLHRDLTRDISGMHVLLVDDILESGRTLAYAKAYLAKRGAKTVSVAVLLHKEGKEKVDVSADFVGFPIDDQFVVGYGLDHAGRFRELPFIGVVDAGA